MPSLRNSNDYLLLKWLVYLASDYPQYIIPKDESQTLYESGIDNKMKEKLTKISIAEDKFFKMALIFLRIQA